MSTKDEIAVNELALEMGAQNTDNEDFIDCVCQEPNVWNEFRRLVKKAIESNKPFKTNLSQFKNRVDRAVVDNYKDQAYEEYFTIHKEEE